MRPVVTEEMRGLQRTNKKSTAFDGSHLTDTIFVAGMNKAWK